MRNVLTAILLCVLLALLGCYGPENPVRTFNLVMIKGQYMLDDMPTGNWENISVSFSGKDNVGTMTDRAGNIRVNVHPGVYTVSAGKQNYDSVTCSAEALVAGVEVTLKTQKLYLSSPPPIPSK